MDGDELEWNMAGNRIKFIAALTIRVRATYSEYLTDQDVDSLRNWFNMVSVLYEELRIYLDDIDNDDYNQDAMDTEIDRLRNYILQSNAETAQQYVDDLRRFDRKLQTVRKRVGLDIPSKTSLDPDKALTEGLS